MATYIASSRFQSLDEEELDKIIDKKDCNCTKAVINSSVNILRQYCEAKGSSIKDIEDFAAQELNGFLRTFYAEVAARVGLHAVRL